MSKLFNSLETLSSNPETLNPYSTSLDTIQSKYDELGSKVFSQSGSDEMWITKQQEWTDTLQLANDTLATKTLTLNVGVSQKIDFIKNGGVQILQSYHDIQNEVRKFDGDMGLIQEGCSENVLGSIAGIVGNVSGELDTLISENFDTLTIKEGIITLQELQDNIDQLNGFIITINDKLDSLIDLLDPNVWKSKSDEAVSFIKAYAVAKLVEGNPCASVLKDVFLPGVNI